MKSLKKVGAIVLAAAIVMANFVIANNSYAASMDSKMSKCIYFPGKYKRVSRSKDSNMVNTTLSLGEYSSYESGKKVGSAVFNTWGGRWKPGGELIYVGKNKYKIKNFCAQKTTVWITVYKNYVKVRQTGKAVRVTRERAKLDFSGTYKLKKRYRMS